MKRALNQEAETHVSTCAESKILAGPVRVSEVMTCETIALRPNQSLADVVALMANRSIHQVLVVDAEERRSGVISDRDVLRALSRTPNWNKKSVSEIMTSEPMTANPDMPLSVAVQAMLAMRLNCLPVVGADGRVCGILTSTDLLKTYEQIQSLIEKKRSSETT